MLRFDRANGARILFPCRGWIRRLTALLGCTLILMVVQAHGTSTSYRQTVLAIQQHIQSNDLDGARAMLATAFKRYPLDAGLENLLGVTEAQLGDVNGAKKAFSDAIQHNPKLVSAYLNLGRIYMENAGSDSNEWNNALHLYEKVLQMDPASAEANYQAATLFMWAGKYSTSREHLAKLDQAAHAEIRVEALVCADDAGLGLKNAASRAAAAMAANPDLSERDAVFVLPALRAAHRADLVDELFTAADARHPLSASGLRVLGLAKEAEGEPEQARTILKRAFAMDSSQVAPLIDLTRIAVADKDYKEALGYLAHARALKPDDASLAYEFGRICLNLDLLGEAHRAMGEAAKMDPANPDYNFAMGVVSSYAQDPSGSLPYLRKYHEMRPNDAAGVLALGTAYFRNDDYNNASTWLKNAATHAATAASARYYLGRILRAQGQYEQAIAQLNKAAALEPDRPEVDAELGQVYLQMRNYPEARKQLDRALALDANSYAANFGLLELYAFTRDPKLSDQQKRFDAIKNKSRQQYREAMRVIEVRPQVEFLGDR